MGENEKALLLDAFDSNWIAPLGPHVDAFENEIASYIGIGYAVALNSGTAALHLAIKLVGVKEGDKVLCPSLTFAASANAILYEKAIPVFVDVDLENWLLDIPSLENIFLVSSSRAKLTTIQRIGRCLRIDKKNPLKVANIVDLVLDEDLDEDGKIVNSDQERKEWITELSKVKKEKNDG